MKKTRLILGVTAVLLACGSSKENAPRTTVKAAPVDDTEFAQTITYAELKEMIYTYDSDGYQGTKTGEARHERAVNYIKDIYTNENITPLHTHVN